MPSALVIDDEASSTQIVSYFLSDAGFEVEAAASGPEGLHKASLQRPDVIVVDVMMPEMDGYQVCRRLRSDPRTARAVIVVLTARSQPVDKGMALRSGADLYVAKPARSQDLIQEIQECLAQRPLGALPPGYQITALRLAKAVGATTLVTNLAVSLAGERGQLTTLAEMVFEGGQIANQLDLPSTSAWEEFSAGDADWIAHLACHNSGLFALPAPVPAPEAGPPEPATVEQALQMLRAGFDYVVLDTPVNPGPLAAVLLSSSSLILMVLTPDTASLRGAQASLAALRRIGDTSLQIWPVLNMVRSDPRPLQQQVEETLGLPLMAALPWAPEECEDALSNRTPVVLRHPKSSLATAIQTLAAQIVQARENSAQEETSA